MYTKKLYYENTKQWQFQATILDCIKTASFYEIVLDQTSFFPEGGGQMADTGTLGGCVVHNVLLKDHIIYHLIDSPLTIGSVVDGQLDWNARFDKMQQHSGEHIISGLIHKHFGFQNVGFHLGEKETTLDFDGLLTKEQLESIEYLANGAVFENIPIQTSFPSKEALSQITYRSKIELDEDVRLVNFPGYDICACCAPHVEFTGEIGLIKIANMQKFRSGIRLTMLCGYRALADYYKKLEDSTKISTLLSAKPDALVEGVIRIKEETMTKQARIDSLQAQLLEEKIARISLDQTHVFLFVKDLDPIAVRNGVNQLINLYQGYCGIFIETKDHCYQYILGSSTLDCQIPAALFREKFEAKGGGSKQMIQGRLIGKEADILALFSL